MRRKILEYVSYNSFIICIVSRNVVSKRSMFNCDKITFPGDQMTEHSFLFIFPAPLY